MKLKTRPATRPPANTIVVRMAVSLRRSLNAEYNQKSPSAGGNAVKKGYDRNKGEREYQKSRFEGTIMPCLSQQSLTQVHSGSRTQPEMRLVTARFCRRKVDKC
jgi:hypothetical protein